LKRKRPDEPVEIFRYDRTEDLERFARMCARWAADNIDRLRHADPLVPASLYNRAADNWRPLLAIADVAGGEWPERARVIAARTVDADETKRIGLLADIRHVFDVKNVEQIKSAGLVGSLVAMEGHPWAEFGRSGKPLSPNSLARMLANDHISPDTIRFDDGLAKGYRRRQFDDAFARYLPQPSNSTVTPLQPERSYGFSANSQPLQADDRYGSGNAQNPSGSAECYGVTVEKPDAPEGSKGKRFRL
jgi:putative DNA primase/helicase